MPVYPLGTVMEVVESIKNTKLPMKVAYAYDDLVFLEHNAFLLQFTEKPDEVLIHRNIEAEQDEIDETIGSLLNAETKENIRFLEAGFYSMKQADEENINIEFIKDAPKPC